MQHQILKRQGASDPQDSLGRPHLHSPSLACRAFLIKKTYKDQSTHRRDARLEAGRVQQVWVPAGRALRQSLPRACVRRSSWRGLRLRSRTTHAPSQAHELQQLRQRSTLHDTTLRHQRQRSDGRQSFVRDRRVMGVRPGMLCILVLRTASPRVVPPTRARGTCAHVDVRLAACCCL